MGPSLVYNPIQAYPRDLRPVGATRGHRVEGNAGTAEWRKACYLQGHLSQSHAGGDRYMVGKFPRLRDRLYGRDGSGRGDLQRGHNV